MLNDEKYQHLISGLYEAISSNFEDEKNNKIYSTQLPNKIQVVKEEESFNFGHPIKWMFSGYAGNHAFVIGDVFGVNSVQDDHTEQNYYPPILTQTLASLGSEYVYSQLAIVLLEEDASEETVNWLNEWCDDPRYFRKVLVQISSDDETKMVGKQIVENILFPWNSIKSSPLSNTVIAEVFNDEEEEEDE